MPWVLTGITLGFAAFFAYKAFKFKPFKYEACEECLHHGPTVIYWHTLSRTLCFNCYSNVVTGRINSIQQKINTANLQSFYDQEAEDEVDPKEVRKAIRSLDSFIDNA